MIRDAASRPQRISLDGRYDASAVALLDRAEQDGLGGDAVIALERFRNALIA